MTETKTPVYALNLYDNGDGTSENGINWGDGQNANWLSAEGLFQSITGAVATRYVMPGGGIPLVDLETSLQTVIAAAVADSPGSNEWLITRALAQAFTVTAATRDVNEAITTATVVWPDGTGGTFTTTTASTAFPGAIDAYTVTYIGATTKTVTQTAVTRDAAGAVTAQPTPTVS